MSSSVYRADLELPQLPNEGITAENVIDSINLIVNYLNFLTKNISLQSNFNCYIAEAQLAAGAEVKIQHFLGIVPRYRIILRQEGNGVISDIPSGWNTSVIVLKNNGSETVQVTVMIVRE